MNATEPCPGCRALLPVSEAPTHPYIGASGACWDLFSNLHNGNEPPLMPGPYNGLLIDAYAAQHPGVPSNQATQSVAVHLLALYGVFEAGVSPQSALWVRQRALQFGRNEARHARYVWLTPPDFTGSITIREIVQLPTAERRTARVNDYVAAVWSLWAARELVTLASWYAKFVAKG